MDHPRPVAKKRDPPPTSCLSKCTSCFLCCHLPPSAGAKFVSVLSILFGLFYSCIGVWTLIVCAQNAALPPRRQFQYEIRIDPVANVQEDSIYVNNPTKIIPLQVHHALLIGLACTSLGVGFVRVLTSIFLLWNSVEKHSTLPGKLWIFLQFCGSITILTLLLVTLNITGLIQDCPLLSPVRFTNDKFSFYILLTIFRILCVVDVLLTLYFICIVGWFVWNTN